MRSLSKLILLIGFVLVTASNSALAQQMATVPTLEALLTIPSVKKLSVRERAVYFANVFLTNKTPYVVEPLGEGPKGEISKAPLYRFDGFDCTTFVETVMALALSTTPAEFKARMNQIRYKDGSVNYVMRNHFTSVDWIPNNQAYGFVKDITLQVAGAHTKWSQTWIDKAGWYAKKGDEFAGLGEDIPKTLAQLAYIAKEDLLNIKGLEDRIPSGSIFSLVRPNWDLVNAAGTRMDVSHQGFLIREDGILYMVHASNGAGRDGSDNYMGVKKESLRSYISRVMLSRETMAGFNILALPKNILN
jgi:hypothetical protein